MVIGNYTGWVPLIHFFKYQGNSVYNHPVYNICMEVSNIDIALGNMNDIRLDLNYFYIY